MKRNEREHVYSVSRNVQITEHSSSQDNIHNGSLVGDAIVIERWTMIFCNSSIDIAAYSVITDTNRIKSGFKNVFLKA